MVYKYGWDDSASDADITASFERAMLANANRGGENVGPGSLIGALLGAAAGHARLPSHFVEDLAKGARPALDEHIEAFVASSPFAGTGAGSEGEAKCST